jgi:hypothetical protein
MATRAITIKRSNLDRLVTEYPDKAVEILLRCCHDWDIEKEIMQFLLDAGQPPKSKPLDALDTTNTNNAHVNSTQRSSPVAQRTSLFSSHRRQPSRNISGIGPNAEPPSPPKSASNHSKSLASKEGKENILILTTDENDDIKKLPATMKPAPIKYSVISQHMFSAGRICENETEEIEEQQIYVPRRGVPGTFLEITVSFRAELTWKRSRSTSNASHRTTFYLVDQEFLDIDILLGSPDSGEGMFTTLVPKHPSISRVCYKNTHADWPDMPEPMPPPFQKGQAFKFREHTSSAHAGSSHLESFHRSDANDDPSHYNRTQPVELVHDFLRNQRERAAVPPRNAPGATSKQRTDPSSASRPATADPASPTHTAGQSPGSEKIRVSCISPGSGPFKFWLDLDAPAQVFFDTVRPLLEKKRGPFDRTTASFLFGRDKQMSHDEVSDQLPLGEDELEADWEDTVTWIRDNKRDTAPQIYAAVQFDEG